MNRTRIAACTLLAAAGLARADHIPGHEPCDPTFPMPIPGPEFFNSGILFVTLIGPVEGTIITGTTFDITYVTNGATPASDLQLAVTAQVDDAFVEFVVTGADLGFGAGPGTFTGQLATDALNGEVWQSLFPHSIVELEISAIDGGIELFGYFLDSFITFDVVPAPPCAATGACCRPDGSCAVVSQATCEDVGGTYQGDGTMCTGCSSCPFDLDGSGGVGVTDLLALLAAWGTDPGGPPDFDANGDVGTTDLLALLANWGTCP